MMETCTLREYFKRSGVDISFMNEYTVADNLNDTLDNLHLVTVDKEHHCWRYLDKYLFCDFTDVNWHVRCVTRRLRCILRINYHPDKCGGDSTKFNMIYHFLKSGGPSDAERTKVMGLISSIYKKLINENVSAMSITSLRQYCLNFMCSLSHINNSVKNKIFGTTMIDLPGIADRLRYMMNIFVTKVKNVLMVTGDTSGVIEIFNKLSNSPVVVPFMIDNFKRAYTSITADVIKKVGSIDSILFTSAASAIHKVLESFLSLGMEEFNMFRERILLSSTTSPQPEIIIEIKQQKRPKQTKRTWRDKRPTPIVTNIPVDMSGCMHNKKKKTVQIRRPSKRIAKLYPRRSVRLSHR